MKSIRYLFPAFLLLSFVFASDEPIPDSIRSEVLAVARAVLETGDTRNVAISDPNFRGPYTAMLSLSREKATALVSRGEGDTLARAVTASALSLRKISTNAERLTGRIKADVLVQKAARRFFDRHGQARIDRTLDGLLLLGPHMLLLPEELCARKLITTEGDLQSDFLKGYMAETARAVELKENPGKAGKPYYTIRFDAFMEDEKRAMIRLFRGNLSAPVVEPENLLDAARSGGEYLLQHQSEDGLFDYSYEPKTDELNDDYNELRHAGTSYSLVQLYEATGDLRFLKAARKGIRAMDRWVRAPKAGHSDRGFETIVYQGEEAKLGGPALAMLAMLQADQATGEEMYLAGAKKFGEFLVFQQEQNGRFESKYFYREPDAESFESLYYPGEAILALTRLSRADQDPRWLQAANRGAEWLIKVRDAGAKTSELPHDHWLLIALNELYALTKSKLYLDHAQRIATAILQQQRMASSPHDWTGSFYDPPRSTPTATRAEGFVAMWHLAGQAAAHREQYLKALKLMVGFQLRCQFTPENVIYLPRPDRALGGFRRSLDNWEVRIDYVQHNISAMLGLREILLEEMQINATQRLEDSKK